MKDFLGNELQIGDTVIYIKYSSNSKQYLIKSTIEEFKKVGSNVCAYMKGGLRGVSSQNIYKV